MDKLTNTQALDNFEKLVNEVFSGNDEQLKAKLMQKWEGATKKRKMSTLDDATNFAKKVKLDPKMNPTLPSELWMKIMTYLKTKDMFGSFALVSKHFNSLTHNSSSIKYLQIRHIRVTDLDQKFYFGGHYNPKDIKNVKHTQFSKVVKLLKQSKQLNELSIDTCDDLAMNMFSVVALRNCRSLKSLKLSSVQIVSKDLNLSSHLWDKWSTKLVQLSKSKLERIEFNNIYLKPHIMIEVCKMNTIKSIRISHSSQTMFTVEAIETLANTDNPLETLEIDDSHTVDSINQKKIALNHLLDKKKDTLKSFKMSNFIGLCNEIDSRWIVPCVSLNLSLCQNLEEFDGGYIHGHDFAMLSKLRNLKKLKFFKHSVAEGPEFKLNFPHLTHLSIYKYNSKCYNLTSYEFPALERLHLYSSAGEEHRIKMNVVDHFVKKCGNLKSIQLDGTSCLDVPNEYIYKLFKESNIFVIYHGKFKSLIRDSQDVDPFEEQIQPLIEMFDYQKSFEEFLLKKDPSLLLKYLNMKLGVSSWCENIKKTQAPKYRNW